ncbi:uncharacterized protein LOC115218238 [Argonauta hians]
MKSLLTGFYLLLMLSHALAGCDITEVTKCQEKYMKKIKEMEHSHDEFCKYSMLHINCLSAASSGCGAPVQRILDQSRKKMKELKCKNTEKLNGSNNIVAGSFVITGCSLATLAFRKLLF